MSAAPSNTYKSYTPPTWQELLAAVVVVLIATAVAGLSDGVGTLILLIAAAMWLVFLLGHNIPITAWIQAVTPAYFGG